MLHCFPYAPRVQPARECALPPGAWTPAPRPRRAPDHPHGGGGGGGAPPAPRFAAVAPSTAQAMRLVTQWTQQVKANMELQRNPPQDLPHEAEANVERKWVEYQRQLHQMFAERTRAQDALAAAKAQEVQKQAALECLRAKGRAINAEFHNEYDMFGMYLCFVKEYPGTKAEVVSDQGGEAERREAEEKRFVAAMLA